MSESPCTDALIEYKKTVRDRWSGEIQSEINRAFHHGYAAGREPDAATRAMLGWASERLSDWTNRNAKWDSESGMRLEWLENFLKAWNWPREGKK